MAKLHTVEKIGGTSMSDFAAVRKNIILAQANGDDLYQRVFVVSAYGGMTDLLLEHKKSGQAGVYGIFADAEDASSWQGALDTVENNMKDFNAKFFQDSDILTEANQFISERIDNTRQCLVDLERVCQHGHFSLNIHLQTVRELLASLGEAHSAWNMARLLQQDGINARYIDLTGWDANQHLSLDQRIEEGFKDVDFANELPIATGYTHTDEGLMASFDRGYSEMTFSRIAVITEAREAIIHKEFHLSSADPRLVGERNAVPIGRTNYDVADQLASLGMEAIHPSAAKGLRQNKIPLRIKNTFEPHHQGTLITGDYVSEAPRVEIIAGKQNVYALELFDQDMMGHTGRYDEKFVSLLRQFKASIISKDINANTITHYIGGNLKTAKRVLTALQEAFPEAEVTFKVVAIVSAIGSDLKVSGMLAKTAHALAEVDISVLAMHQCMRQVDMQFVIENDQYDLAVKSLHKHLVELRETAAA